MPRIAVATGDGETDVLLREALGQESARAVVAGTSTALLSLLIGGTLDAVLLDAALPGLDSMELLRVARSLSPLPIVIVLRRHDALLTAHALDRGADDVVTLTTPLAAITARLHAALDRGRAPEPAPLLVRTGALVVDRASRRVWKGRTPLSLRRTEYAILDALSARVGQVVPHLLLSNVPDWDSRPGSRKGTAASIRRLRTKLEDDARRPRYLVSEWGRGYRLARLPIEGDRLDVPVG